MIARSLLLLSCKNFNVAPLLKKYLSYQHQSWNTCLSFIHSFIHHSFILFRRGSPLVIGVKTKSKLSTDHIPVFYSKGNYAELLVINLLKMKPKMICDKKIIHLSFCTRIISININIRRMFIFL